MNKVNLGIEAIINHQLQSGMIVASKESVGYKYCFIKDSTYCAYALDLAGYHFEAGRFYTWSSLTISELSHKINKSIKRKNNEECLLNSDFMQSIFTPEGYEDEQRSHFQLDPYGTWLWGICNHVNMTNNDDVVYYESIKLIADYLVCFWQTKCYGCWEEMGERNHTATLAAIYGGLIEAAKVLKDDVYKQVAKSIKDFILENCVFDNRFSKFAQHNELDASLLYLALPYKVVDLNDKIMLNTITAIEQQLIEGDGLHRFIGDTYFGGGRWVMLNCLLAWYYKEIGATDKEKVLMDWVESTRDERGHLPEQDSNQLYNDEYLERWKEVFGDIVCPSLWAHSMYIIEKLS